MGYFGDFYVLNASREGSRFVSKVCKDIGHTLAPYLVFTVQEDLGP